MSKQEVIFHGNNNQRLRAAVASWKEGYRVHSDKPLV